MIMKITLIGLGVQEGDLSARAEAALKSGAKIFARTSKAPAFASLNGYDVCTLDGLFESSRNFDTLNKKLAKAVLDASKQGDVVYCVDGAVCEDTACRMILSRHKDTLVIEGVSKAAHISSLARLKSTQVTGISAYDIGNLKSSPAVAVYDMDDFYAASEVKIKLSDLFGEEAECAFVSSEGVKKIKVYEIDRMKHYDMSCGVAVEEADFLHKQRYDYADLVHMVELLRAPGGCPWDRAQTNESIRINMIEEAYELVDAVNKDDDDMIEEETGDVLLQAAFHTVMKGEQGSFTAEDVTTRVVKKLIFRHSHIFGKDKAKDEADALGVWEKNKREEKHQSTFGETVAAVPSGFPSCMRAQKVQKRAAKAGLDYLSSVSAAEQLSQDAQNCVNALVKQDKQAAERACGELLFTAVGLCRLAGADCEQALADATDQFSKKFIKAEEIAISQGKNVSDFTELDWKWYLMQAENALKKD